MAGRGKAVDRSNALGRQLPEKFAQAGAFAADDRDIAVSDLTEIEYVRFGFAHCLLT
jgi:hypothetical protein